MKILITGITGFVGSHLAEYILSLNEGHEIYGLCRWRSNKENLKGILSKIHLLEGDLTDLSSLINVCNTRFDIVFHLAAQSFVPTSFYDPIATMNVNVNGTINLLDALRLTSQDPIIHICSSSEVYGQVAEHNVPITEDCPFNPASPYAVSKVGEDMVGLQYHLSYGMKTVRSRAFTHSGARRGENFVLSAFAKQIASAELGLSNNVIKVGNLESVRTFCDISDMVRAYWLLVTYGVIGEVYNIGGVETMEIKEALNILLSVANVKCEIIEDEKLLRPSDVTLQIPDISKFQRATKWTPQVPFIKTCKDILNYWRQELKHNEWKKI